jgi:hypothetical protein
MPPKVPAASSEELSRTMDGRLQAMMGWAERAADPASADAKLTDWFGKWLKSYELEQHAFKSAQIYGEVKMNETLNSSTLDRLANPSKSARFAVLRFEPMPQALHIICSPLRNSRRSLQDSSCL